MQTFLLKLPPGLPEPAAVYSSAWLHRHATNARLSCKDTPLALLSPAGRQVEVVAMVPACALSWHRVTLPAGLGRASARLQAALIGLLEEQLLQDPAQLHLALPASWRAGEPTWVAACDKAWLQSHLHALEQAGLPVQRIVPELSAPEQGEVWHALGDEASGWLWCCSADSGVNGWPVSAASQLPGGWLTADAVQTEPALATWVQAHLNTSTQLVDPASHWHQALASSWDLAQFELQYRAHGRQLQSLRRLADTLLRQPQWRPARWGLAALLIAQVCGLNAWAWMTRQQWQAEQAQWTTLLQQSFPQVTVVLDAPLQMAREVARLQQGAGQLGPQDFESMLHAVGSALPPQAAGPAGLSYQDGVLQWPEMALNPVQKEAFEQALLRQGYRLQVQERTWRLQTREATP